MVNLSHSSRMTAKSSTYPTVPDATLAGLIYAVYIGEAVIWKQEIRSGVEKSHTPVYLRAPDHRHAHQDCTPRVYHQSVRHLQTSEYK